MGYEIRYNIQDNNGTQTFGTESVENWADLKPELVRNKTYKGLVSGFTNTFTFVKSIRQRFRNLLDTQGTNALVNLLIYLGNKNNERNSFKQIGDGQSYVADFTKCEVDELRCKLNFEDSSFANKFFSRQKEKINYNGTTNLDGGEMSTYELDEITLHDRTIHYNSRVEIPEESYLDIPFSIGVIDASTIPYDIVYKSDDNIKNVAFNGINNLTLAETYLYLISEKSRSLTLNMSFDFIFKTSSLIYLSNLLYLDLAIRIVDAEYNEKQRIILDTNVIDMRFGGDGFDKEFLYNYSGVNTLQINEGDSFQIMLISNTLQGWLAPYISISDNNSYIEIDSIEYSTEGQTTAECIKPHELFTRFTEFITGEKNAFHSNVFGRTDLGYEIDGEWSNLVTLNGKMIRGFPFDKSPYNSTFEDIFNYYNSIDPLSLWIEYIGGKPRIRIEKYADSFDLNITSHDFGGSVNEMTRKIREEAIYTTIKAGYKDQEYEEINGIDSVHGEINFTTPLKAKDKVYDIVNKIRAGGYDIEFPRRKHYTTFPTEDTRYDKDNYLIDAYINSGSLIARRDELFSLVEGISNPKNAYNLRLSPKRNLLRHGGIIKECLFRNDDELLIYTKGANNQELITQLLTESEPLIEKDNIKISDLQRPKFLAELFTFTAPLKLSGFNSINSYKNNLITFVDISGKKLSGVIDDFKWNVDTEECEVTLIRANR